MLPPLRCDADASLSSTALRRLLAECAAACARRGVDAADAFEGRASVQAVVDGLEAAVRASDESAVAEERLRQFVCRSLRRRGFHRAPACLEAAVRARGGLGRTVERFAQVLTAHGLGA